MEKLTAEKFIPLSKELKRKRELLRLTPREVYEAVGVSKSNYSNMESGLVNPEKALAHVTKAFEVQTPFMLKYHKDKIKEIKSLSSCK